MYNIAVFVSGRGSNLISLFNEAYKDDKETATKLLFRLRDPRSGSGEKAAFNKVLYS